MRSASASAAPTIDSACVRWFCTGARTTLGGSGGSCWKANPSSVLDELRIVLLGPADHDRAGLLELADDGDDASLRLLDHAAALRRLELHLLRQHLRAALGHVLHDLVLHLVGDAAQGQGQVLLVDLLEDELQ